VTLARGDSAREGPLVVIAYRRPNPEGQHRTRLTCFLGIAFGLSVATVGTYADRPAPSPVEGDGLLMNRAIEHLALQKRRTEIPPAYAPITYAWFAQLPTPETRTAPELAAIDEMERQAVTLAGYIVRVIPVPTEVARGQATEWEFHLHLRVGPAQRCEYQDDPRNLVTVVTPAFQPPRTGWDFDVLRELCEKQIRVRLSGWLLYDYLTRAQVGRSRVSPWAIHPLTRIEVWNAGDRSWDRLR
jgi:hypothetical protein